jgi:hypothetical protein
MVLLDLIRTNQSTRVSSKLSHAVTQTRFRRKVKSLPVSKRNATGIKESMKSAKAQPCGSLTPLKNLSEPVTGSAKFGVDAVLH